MGAYKMWVCDWCRKESRSKDDDYGPDGWDEVDNELLCHDCRAVRSEALAKARNDRAGVNRRDRSEHPRDDDG